MKIEVISKYEDLLGDVCFFQIQLDYVTERMEASNDVFCVSIKISVAPWIIKGGD